MSRTPDEFANIVAGIITDLRPGVEVGFGDGFQLVVNGRVFDLTNLWRMVQSDFEHMQEIVRHYCEEILDRMAEEEAFGTKAWREVKPRLMPRIHPVSIFDQLPRQLVVHRPWVNNTVVSYVCDNPGSTTTVHPEQLDQWGVKLHDVEVIADANLGRYAVAPEFQIVNSERGGRIITIRERDGYDSARILLPEIRERLARSLGKVFYVGIPARDVCVAFSNGPDAFVEVMSARVKAAFERLPYPICPHLFLVTPDGIAGTIPLATSDEGW